MQEIFVQCSVKYLFRIFSFQNFLNNLKDTNVMAFVARIGLFFQMLCVFPLLVFILRLQFMNSVFGTIWPGLVFSNLHVFQICVYGGSWLYCDSLCFVTFPYGVPGQVWYLIVLIPDFCLPFYFNALLIYYYFPYLPSSSKKGIKNNIL